MGFEFYKSLFLNGSLNDGAICFFFPVFLSCQHDQMNQGGSENYSMSGVCIFNASFSMAMIMLFLWLEIAFLIGYQLLELIWIFVPEWPRLSTKSK